MALSVFIFFKTVRTASCAQQQAEAANKHTMADLQRARCRAQETRQGDRGDVLALGEDARVALLGKALQEAALGEAEKACALLRDENEHSTVSQGVDRGHCQRGA